MQRARRWFSVFMATSAAVLVAGCASDSKGAGKGSEGGAKAGYPVTIANCGIDLTFKKAPQRVVILNGASVGEVESFIALDLQSSIVANAQSYGVSDAEGMAKKVADIPTGGLAVDKATYEVPREQILAMKPDLVVSTWAGGFSEKAGTLTRDELTKLGINSYVTPSNCAMGAASPSDADKKAKAEQTYENSYDLLNDLGKIYGVTDRATKVIDESKAAIAKSAQAKPATAPKVMIAFPGMSAMNANGLPAIFTGSLYDSVIAAAGGTNSFAGKGGAEAGSINAEQLAAAEVDVLAVGVFNGDEDAAAYAEQLFATYPHWKASKTKNWVQVSDGIYLGPNNAQAISKLAEAVAKVG